MEVLNFILITVFLIVSVNELIKTIYRSRSGFDEIDAEFVKIIFFTITTVSCLISIMDGLTKLRERDVLNGNAEYVETIHISKGDTIKTYHIETKEKK